MGSAFFFNENLESRNTLVNRRLVPCLYRKDVDVNLGNKAGLTALHLASQAGDVPLARVFYQRRLIQRNYPPSEQMPFHMIYVHDSYSS